MNDEYSNLTMDFLYSQYGNSAQQKALYTPAGTSVSLPEQQVVQDEPIQNSPSIRGTVGLKDTSTGNIGMTTGDINKALDIGDNARAVVNFADAAASALQGVGNIYNGLTAQKTYETKAMSYEYMAKQNQRAAELLLKNQVDITRAAQMDSNAYRIQGAKTKSAQRIAMAESGFKVGSGVYKNAISETEARVNYNVSQMMLSADLKNAEATRTAGSYKAQAIMNEASAEIARVMGKAAKQAGTLNAIGSFIKSAASITSGLAYAGAFDGLFTSSEKNLVKDINGNVLGTVGGYGTFSE